LSTGDGGSDTSFMAFLIAPMLSNSRRRRKRCNSPKMKSFVSSTPIWRELSSK